MAPMPAAAARLAPRPICGGGSMAGDWCPSHAWHKRALHPHACVSGTTLAGPGLITGRRNLAAGARWQRCLAPPVGRRRRPGRSITIVHGGHSDHHAACDLTTPDHSRLKEECVPGQFVRRQLACVRAGAAACRRRCLPPSRGRGGERRRCATVLHPRAPAVALPLQAPHCGDAGTLLMHLPGGPAVRPAGRCTIARCRATRPRPCSPPPASVAAARPPIAPCARQGRARRPGEARGPAAWRATARHFRTTRPPGRHLCSAALAWAPSLAPRCRPPRPCLAHPAD